MTKYNRDPRLTISGFADQIKQGIIISLADSRVGFDQMAYGLAAQAAMPFAKNLRPEQVIDIARQFAEATKEKARRNGDNLQALKATPSFIVATTALSKLAVKDLMDQVSELNRFGGSQGPAGMREQRRRPDQVTDRTHSARSIGTGHPVGVASMPGSDD